MTKKPHVLIVAYNNLGKGGIQNQIAGIVRNLHDKVNFDILIWDNCRDYYREELEHYAKIIECFRYTGKYRIRKKADAFIRYNELKRIIDRVIKENGPYDVIHCNNAFDAAPCLEAAYENGVKIRISHAHNTESPELRKKFVYPVYRVLYHFQRLKIRKYATDMIGCSRQVCDYVFGKNYGKIVHIGVELKKFKNIDQKKHDPERINLLHVGNMSYQKNQLFLLEIMKVLNKSTHRYHLTLVGSGFGYYNQVIAKMKEYHLEKYIDLKPTESDVAVEMKKADLFLLPSNFEGFGIVLIEAQAAGLKCLVSTAVTKEADCGGLTYYSLNEGSEKWAKKINKLTKDMIQDIRFSSISEFDMQHMSSKIYQIYNR